MPAQVLRFGAALRRLQQVWHHAPALEVAVHAAEAAALKQTLTRDKDKEIARLATAHQKQLKVRPTRAVIACAARARISDGGAVQFAWQSRERLVHTYAHEPSAVVSCASRSATSCRRRRSRAGRVVPSSTGGSILSAYS